MKLFFILFCFWASSASAQFYSSSFGGEMGVGYVTNPPAGKYTVTATPSVAENFQGITVCELDNLAAVVPLEARTYRPVGGTTSSLTSPSFSTSGDSIVLMGATTNTGGFGATPGAIGRTTAAMAANGANINVEYVTFNAGQTDIRASIGSLGGASIAVPVALATTGHRPTFLNCFPSLQGNSTSASVEVTVSIVGGSGHALIAWSRNASDSQVPIKFSDNSKANGGQGNLWLTLAPNIYYISQSTGSDSHTATEAQSMRTPWKNLPGMRNSSPAYAPSPGDVFILEGCDDWPNESFPLRWTWSGEAQASINIGVDQSWFNKSACPSNWNRPKFDAGGRPIEPPECLGDNLNSFVHLRNASYLSIRWIEETDYYSSNGTCADGGQLNGQMGSDHVHWGNLYLHAWHGPTAVSQYDLTAFACDTCVNSTTDHDVVDNSDGDKTTGANTQIPTTDSIYNFISKAFRTQTPGVYAGNNIGHLLASTTGNRSSGIETLLAGNVYIANNYIHDGVTADAVVAMGDPGETDYVWNNVISNMQGGPPFRISQSRTTKQMGSIMIWNNTIQAGDSGGPCIQIGGVGDKRARKFLAQNNLCIGKALINPTPTAATLTVANNILESAASAHSQGYAETNAYAWSPTTTNCNGIQSNCPIGAGINLMAESAGPVASLGSDTTYACQEETVNTVVLSVCPLRSTVQRPGVGIYPPAWDVGAYQMPPTLSINAASMRQTINPDIYGMVGGNLAANLKLVTQAKIANVRWGGDGATRYNWNYDSTCDGNDNWFICALFGMNSPSYSPDQMIKTYRVAYPGIQILMTIPILPYISFNPTPMQLCSYPVSVYGAQQQELTTGTGQRCGNGYTTNGTPIKDTNIAYNMVPNSTTIEGNWLSHFISTFGTCSRGGVCLYQLDNEPGGWSNTHRDALPNAADYSVIVPLEFTYGDLIHTKDPSAIVLAPSDFGEWGWTNNCPPSSCGGSGQPRYGGQYVLQQWKEHDAKLGYRELACFDEHFSFGTNDGSVAHDFDQNRDWWDTNYNDGSTFARILGGHISMVPLFQDWISTYYPGTPICISEYETTVIGNAGVDAADLADGLGLMGYYGIRLANMYPSPQSLPGPADPQGYAFKMFRNYDGAGHQFGDISVTSTSTDQTTLAVYGATRSGDNHLTVIVINKSRNPITTSLAVSGFSASTAVKTYTYDTYTPGIFPSSTMQAGGVISGYGFPAYSITLLDFSPDGK